MSISNRIAAELRGDRTIWMVIALLSLFSILAVYSASSTAAWQSPNGNTTVFLMGHLMRLGAGLGLVYLCHLLHYRQYQRMAPWLILLAVPLLGMTLFFGMDINDANRWLKIPGLGISFQTSEFAKIALVIYLARELTRKQDYISSFKDAFLPIIVPVLIVCGMIAPANLSTASLLFMTSIVLMFIGRVSIQYIALLATLGLVVFAFLVALGRLEPDLVRVETWYSRMNEFMNNPDGGYQVQQAKIAIAQGGFFGVGPGNSLARNFLPYASADFIYAIICEEYGMLGGLLLMALYTTLFLRTVKLVTRSPKAFGAFLAIGLSLSITTQALANMAVNLNLLPATGVTLPLISMGGSSLLFTCIALGMILSVSKYIESIE
jgi:cell division protein FtsW